MGLNLPLLVLPFVRDCKSCTGSSTPAACPDRRRSGTRPHTCRSVLGCGSRSPRLIPFSVPITNSSHPADAMCGGAGLNWRMSLAPDVEKVTSTAVQPRRGITRRQALAVALASGVGVGAVRLLGGSMQNLARPKAALGMDWTSPLGSKSARVMQLLRRTSFGYTPAQLDTALSDGFNKTCL